VVFGSHRRRRPLNDRLVDLLGLRHARLTGGLDGHSVSHEYE
jgi:hypothetical protein